MRVSYIVMPFVLLLLMITPAHAQNDYILHGKVVMQDKQSPVEGASIINMRSQRATISDANGQFLIKGQKGDSLIIRSLGFRTQQFIIQDGHTANDPVVFVLNEESVSLQEVKIVGLPPLDQLMREYGKKKATHSNVRNPNIPKPEPRVIPTETGVSLGSPISALYGMLSKEGKQLRKLEELKQKEKEAQELKEKQKYNRFFKDNTGYE